MSADTGQQPSERMVRWACTTLRKAYDDYLQEFQVITRRAKRRFETCDWRGGQRDALARLTLVSEHVWQSMLVLRTQFGDRIADRALWAQIKTSYARAIEGLPTVELAETFYNSVTRRIFSTLGVDAQIEFVSPEARPGPSTEEVTRSFTRGEGPGATETLLREILETYRFDATYRSFDEDVKAGAAWIDAHFANREMFERVELACWPFFRGKAAYLVGRAWRGETFTPFILAFRHQEQGVILDAVLLEDRQARILFSFTRSYFHVDVSHPRALVDLLHALLPMRRLSELYISLGFTKHGKTELYREVAEHAQRSGERLVPAEGDRGMVMIVFNYPSLNLVFKVIRDRIPPPKNTSHDEVKAKYNLVYRQDRAGRLVDAQEFEHLTFRRDGIDPRVIDELLEDAPSAIRCEGDWVHLRHLYVERRVRPLNLFLRETDEESARGAVLDYGQAIRDLAATNTFPGDLLLKNFGVTRNGRVIFYDYDELSLVTECQFRDMPTARDDDDDMRAEPWFFVDEDDIFPEEFPRFLGLSPALERVLREEHGELFTAAWWRGIQEKIRAGEIVDIFPYPQSARLRPEISAA